VTLTVRTTAPDADLYVLLSDNFPLGMRDLHLGHAALRLATLKSFKACAPVTVVLELDAIAHDFLPGHQIRLTVTPGLYPLYARNPQVKDYTCAMEPAIADIELLHGPTAAAVLALPLATEMN
jgi:predicted acyl esterase